MYSARPRSLPEIILFRQIDPWFYTLHACVNVRVISVPQPRMNLPTLGTRTWSSFKDFKCAPLGYLRNDRTLGLSRLCISSRFLLSTILTLMTSCDDDCTAAVRIHRKLHAGHFSCTLIPLSAEILVIINRSKSWCYWWSPTVYMLWSFGFCSLIWTVFHRFL